MAHKDNKKKAVRAAYIHNRLPLSVAALMNKVSVPTARRWKNEAFDNGDDWDKAKTASSMAGGNSTEVVKSLIEDFVLMHQKVIDSLKTTEGISPIDQAKTLATLADTFAKTMKAAGRVAPELSKLAIANDIIMRFGEFITSNYPKHAEIFVEILTPFAEELAGVYAE